jgi:hypothetical protein
MMMMAQHQQFYGAQAHFGMQSLGMGPFTVRSMGGDPLSDPSAPQAVDLVAQFCANSMLNPLRKLQKIRQHFTEVPDTVADPR